MGRSVSISAAAARRIALGAQGFGEPRPTGRVDRRHLRRVLGRMGLVQIDSVNVLVRSQELPLFARLGPHPRTLLPEATDAGELFEYWVHEASHVPIEHYHLHRWAMERQHRWAGVRRLSDERPGFVEDVLAYVAEHGPVVAGDVSRRTTPKGSWWDWDDGKIALEHLFHTGAIAVRRRRSDFARLYDIAERVIPHHVLHAPTPSEADAKKEMLVLAAKYHGVGTAGDLADYHRLTHTRGVQGGALGLRLHLRSAEHRAIVRPAVRLLRNARPTAHREGHVPGFLADARRGSARHVVEQLAYAGTNPAQPA